MLHHPFRTPHTFTRIQTGVFWWSLSASLHLVRYWTTFDALMLRVPLTVSWLEILILHYLLRLLLAEDAETRSIIKTWRRLTEGQTEEVTVECQPYNSERYNSRIYNSELCNSRYTTPCSSSLLIRKACRLPYLLESEYRMSFSCEYGQSS